VPAVLQREARSSVGTLARVVNVALGTWLFSTGAFWDQSLTARCVALVLGAAIALVAVLGFWREDMRFINALLALGLLFATVTVPLLGPAMWNADIVAMAVFAVALIPNEPSPQSFFSEFRR
jgi:hypothetical protein